MNYKKHLDLLYKFRSIKKYLFKNFYKKTSYLFCNYNKTTKLKDQYKLNHICTNKHLQFKRYKTDNIFKHLYKYNL